MTPQSSCKYNGHGFNDDGVCIYCHEDDGTQTKTSDEAMSMPDTDNKITCSKCGAKNVPAWDYDGTMCISCTRDKLLGDTDNHNNDTPYSKIEPENRIKTMSDTDNGDTDTHGVKKKYTVKALDSGLISIDVCANSEDEAVELAIEQLGDWFDKDIQLYATETSDNRDSLREQIHELATWIVEFEFNNPANRHMNHRSLVELYSEKIGAFYQSHSLQEQTRYKIELLKKDIKYHTLKAKYQRVYLGGDEEALATKHYVKKLKAELEATLKEKV